MFKTREWTRCDAPITTWIPVSMTRWDTLSDYDREIMVTKDGIVFVERKGVKLGKMGMTQNPPI